MRVVSRVLCLFYSLVLLLLQRKKSGERIVKLANVMETKCGLRQRIVKRTSSREESGWENELSRGLLIKMSLLTSKE